MSIYYSKYDLNTYRGSAYFESHLPKGYPLAQVMQKSRAFRRLPQNLRRLAELSKQWEARHSPDMVEGMKQWYDDQGHELNPGTGRRLTDAEIDAMWPPDPSLDQFVMQDIPVPAGGFPNPDSWEPTTVEEVDVPHRPSMERLLREIASHGREAVAKEYDIPVSQLPRQSTK